MVAGLYNVLWGKRIEQVALCKQGGSGENGSCLDLEEQESGVPVPATRDSIKPVPGSKERTDTSNWTVTSKRCYYGCMKAFASGQPTRNHSEICNIVYCKSAIAALIVCSGLNVRVVDFVCVRLYALCSELLVLDLSRYGQLEQFEKMPHFFWHFAPIAHLSFIWLNSILLLIVG